MSFPSFPHSLWKPEKKILLALILAIAIGSLLPLAPYLSLNTFALSHGFLWTLLTYPFTTLSYAPTNLLLHLVFDLIFLWIFGSQILLRTSAKRFLFLFFGSTLFSALAILPIFLLSSIPRVFAGPSPVLLALITAWVILHARQPLTLKPLWIFLLLVCLPLLIDLLDRVWIRLIADFAGALFGYLFCLISEKAGSELRFLAPFEQALLRKLERPRHKDQHHSKIIDIRTKKPYLDDEQFMDACLARISRYGEDALTPEEKKRMREISERKSK